jgi:uncharacterized membrane protein (UPF0127 family)
MILPRTMLLALAALGLSACLASAAPAEFPGFDHLREARVEVTGSGKTHVFRAWVADTPESRARGLMYVRELPPGRGMLFLFEAPHFASFWMKNTYIPLDLLFVSADGRIVNIVENATPLSLAPMESVAPVTAVLEVAGGTAARLSLRVGDGVAILAEEPGADR